MAARWEATAQSRQGYIMDSPRRQAQAGWRDTDPRRFGPKDVSNKAYPSFLYQRSSHGDPLNQRDPRDFAPHREEDHPDPGYGYADFRDSRDPRDPRDLRDPRDPRDVSPERWQRAQYPEGRDIQSEHWRSSDEQGSPRGGAPPPDQYLSPRGTNGPNYYYTPRGPPPPPPEVQVMRNEPRIEPPPAMERSKAFMSQRYQVARGSYVFIWFATRRQENTDVVAHACVLSKPETFGGRFVGIARKLDETALKFSGDEAIVVFLFENMEMSRKFCECDPRIRQPDFPPPSGICDIIPLLRHYNPENETLYKTFVLSEVLLNEGVNVADYKENFVKPFGDYLHENGAQPFVVQSFGYRFHRRQMPKNHFPADRTIMICHLFRDRFHYQAIRDSPEYQRLKNKQGIMAWEVTTAFSIDPQACP